MPLRAVLALDLSTALQSHRFSRASEIYEQLYYAGEQKRLPPAVAKMIGTNGLLDFAQSGATRGSRFDDRTS